MPTISFDRSDMELAFDLLMRAFRKPESDEPRERLAEIHDIVMAKTAHDAILNRMVWRGQEDGGLLIGPMGHHAVTSFVPDEGGTPTGATFTLGAPSLNRLMKQYVPLGYDCKGIIHMHPPGCGRLSAPDLEYARRLMRNPKNSGDRLLMPLVVDGRIVPYIIFPEQPERPFEGNLVLF